MERILELLLVHVQTKVHLPWGGQVAEDWIARGCKCEAFWLLLSPPTTTAGLRGTSVNGDLACEDSPPTSLGTNVTEAVSETGAGWPAAGDAPESAFDDDDANLWWSTTSDESTPKDGNWDHWLRLASHMLVLSLGDDREEYEEGMLLPLLSLPLLFSLRSKLLLEFVQPFKQLESNSVFQPPKSIASVLASRAVCCLDPAVIITTTCCYG